MSEQTYNPSIINKRKQRDIARLKMSEYKVNELSSKTNNNNNNNNNNEMHVQFNGPKDSLYQGGVWTIRVFLPPSYPYKSPSIGFVNNIYHPNVDEPSGSVCLDVINESWSPMYDLVNIFDTFLPQLLMYPNPHHPLNPEAAALMNSDLKKYEQKVRDKVKQYAMNTSIKLEQEQSQQKQQDQSHSGLNNIKNSLNQNNIIQNQCQMKSCSNQQIQLKESMLIEDEQQIKNEIVDDDEKQEQLSQISVEDISDLSDNDDIDNDAVQYYA